MEVKGCGYDCAYECDECEWEECTLLAFNDATCNVRISSDGEECLGVPRRHVRLSAVPPTRSSERVRTSPNSFEAGPAPSPKLLHAQKRAADAALAA